MDKKCSPSIYFYTLVVLSLVFSSCVPVSEFKEESSELEFFDKEGRGGKGGLFFKAREVLNSRCLTCHTKDSRRGWGVDSLATERDWLQKTPIGLIAPGNIKDSQLIRKMIHYPGGGGNMPTGASSSSFSKEEYLAIENWVTSLGVPGDCVSENLIHGESEVRVRYETSTVPFGSECVSERQTRSCRHGLATSYSGTFSQLSCEVESPVLCVAGESESRTMYLTSNVSFGSTCISEVQTRTCENGSFTPFSGNYSYSACEVLAPASCGGVSHGGREQRIRYRQTQSILPQTCEAETQERICHNGSWSDFSGSFSFPTCQETNEANPRLRGFEIIESNCLSCHHHNLDFSRNEESFISSKFYNSAAPEESLILKRLVGHGERNSNMPPSYSNEASGWNNSLYNEFKSWLNLISPSNSGTVTQYGRFNCDEASELQVTPLKRLSRLEIVETYNTIIREVENRDNAWTGWINGALSILPEDDSKGFKEEDNTFSSTHIIGLFNAANEMAHWLTEGGTRCRRGVKEWLGDTDHVLCNSSRSFNNITSSSFKISFERIGLRLFRRPVTLEEVTEHYNYALEDIADGLSLAHVWRNQISLMLQSPYFVNHSQLNGQSVSGREDTYFLTPYELASKLSYAFWKRQPDKRLFDYARTGHLNFDATKADYEEVINYIFNRSNNESISSGSFKNSLKAFLIENYQLDKTHSYGWMPENKVTEYITSRGIVRPSNNNHFVSAQKQEVFDLFNYYTFSTQGTFSDILTSNLYFTKDPTIASIYGVTPLSDGAGPGNLNSSQYAGLTTRVFMNFKGKGDTNPIHRGVRLRESILCDQLTAPEDVLSVEEQLIALKPPAFDHTISTLERFDDKVSDPVCMGCHSLINPLGNIHESYDTSGRFRNEERVIHRSNIESIAIPNQNLVPQIESGDLTTSVSNPVALAQEFNRSGKAHACFAQKIFEYTNYRSLNNNLDQCVAGKVYEKLQTGSLLEAIKEIVLHPSFKMKKVN